MDAASQMQSTERMGLTAQPASGVGKKIAVLTSGGDAQGMNAAVRAVVRTALHLGAQAYAVFEGYQGMVDGGAGIRRMGWDDVGSVLHKSGTVIGTFRSKDFRERDGRKRALEHLLEHRIDRLVVIGGDGSLSGLDAFRQEWPQLLAELVAEGRVAAAVAEAHPALMIAGLVGSIDNDLVGTDMTIGADTALHRIVDAIDALGSTAASHQRSFVVEVMGRHCGYLTLMSAIAGGCDYALIPENPPAQGWEEKMCAELRRGRQAGRRDSIVVVAEGAQDREGNRISADYVRSVLEERLHEDTRVTILGHVQRGGVTSAYDRWASTWLGFAAAHEVLDATPESEGMVISIRGSRIAKVPLMEAVRRTRQVPELIAAHDYAGAMELRGGSFIEMSRIFGQLAEPPTVHHGEQAKRIALVHAGGLAPGMNTAAWACVRLGIERGHQILGGVGGFPGLRDGQLRELSWGDVEGWTSIGGAELGISRSVPPVEQLYSIGRSLEEHRIDALLVIGGWNAYQGANLLFSERDRYPAFRIPIVCLPASIDNNLPGSSLSIGADTALNEIAHAIDRIKQSASATKRVFVVETMGRYCGYLALLGGIAGGAERVYLHEQSPTLEDLVADVEWITTSFDHGRRLFLAVRNERASQRYTTGFLASLFDQESRERYDVRSAVIGHLQQGGDPSPFDRVLATRLASHGVDVVDRELAAGTAGAHYLGLVDGKVQAAPMAHIHDEIDPAFRRPRRQWWLGLRPVIRAVSEAEVVGALDE